MGDLELSDFIEDFVGLTAKQKVLKAELKSVTKMLEESGELLMDELAKNGLEKITGEFGTVYKRTTRHHSMIDKDKVAKLLTEAGYGDLLSLNAMTLNSLMRELQEREGLDGYERERRLLSDLQEFVSVYEKTKPVLRKS
jgi:phage host-nuclease inhibitor protein Gam